MKNLKRVLSLVLASTMLVGMMVVGAGAYTHNDVTAENNVEAIEVLTAMGIMGAGEEFNPEQNLTRGEMAVIMTNLLDYDVEDYKGITNFTDVTWSAPYVDAMYANKIMAGVSATEFGEKVNVTTAQAALMLVKALGYYEYKALEDWRMDAIKTAAEADILDGVNAKADDALTRNEIATMVLNALEATCVKETQTSAGATVKGDGMEVVIGANITVADVEDDGTNYDLTSGATTADTMELIEKRFGDDFTKDDGEDKFARPATVWYDENNDKIIAVPDAPIAVYAGAKFDEDTMEDDFDKWTDDANNTNFSDAEIYYNGENTGLTLADLEESRKGYTIEIYGEKKDKEIERFVVIETIIAEVTDVEVNNEGEKDEETVVTVATETLTFTVSSEDDEDAYALVKDFEKEELFAITVKGDAINDDDASDILAVDELETVEGKVTAVKAGSWMKVDGTQYDLAFTADIDAAIAVKDEATLYLYNGLVIGAEEVEAAEDAYLYVVRAGKESDKLSSDTYYAEVVFVDGTSEIIEVEDEIADADEGKVYAYTYDAKNDIYELTTDAVVIKNDVAVDIETGKTAVSSSPKATANSKTVYIAIELDDSKFDKATVYTGYKSVPTIDHTADLVVDGSVAEYVFIVGGSFTVDAEDLVYIAGDVKAVSDMVEDEDLGDYYTYNAVVDGKIVEIKVEATNTNGTLAGLYDSFTMDGEVYETLDQYVGGDAVTVNNAEFGKASNDVVKIDGETFAYVDDAVLFVVKDGKITKGSIGRNYVAAADETQNITYVMNSKDEITTIFVEKTSI